MNCPHLCGRGLTISTNIILPSLDKRQHDEIVDLYRSLLHGRMLCRVLCMGCDEEFLELVTELAVELGISERDAAELLYPTAQLICHVVRVAR